MAFPDIDPNRKQYLFNAFESAKRGEAIPSDLTEGERAVLADAYDQWKAARRGPVASALGIQTDTSVPQSAEDISAARESDLQTSKAIVGTMGEALVPGMTDITSAAGIGEMRVAAPLIAKAIGAQSPMGRAAVYGGSLLAGIGAKQALEGGAEFIKDMVAGSGDIKTAAQKGEERVFGNPIESTLTIAGGKKLEDVLGGVAKKALPGFVETVQEELSRKGAAAAVKAQNLSLSALKDFEVTKSGKLRSPTVEAFRRVWNAGIDPTQSPDELITQIGKKKAELGPALSAALRNADAPFRGAAFEKGLTVDVHAEDLIRQKADKLRKEFIDSGQTSYITELDEEIEGVADLIQQTVMRAKEVDPNYELSLTDLSDIKSQIYSGQRYNATNASPNKVKVGRSVGRIIKEVIEESVPDADLKAMNRLYGDLEEVGSVIGAGPFAKFVKGEQVSFPGTLNTLLMTTAAGSGATYMAQEPTPAGMAIAAIAAPVLANQIAKSPAARRVMARTFQQMSLGGQGTSLGSVAIHSPAAYASRQIVNNLANVVVNQAMATELPRDTKRPVSIEIAAPRIAKVLTEAGIPPEQSWQMSLDIGSRLASENPKARDEAAMELSAIAPSAYEKHPLGYNSIFNGRFNDPMEQSHYLNTSLQTASDLREEADRVGAALNGRVTGQQISTEEQLSSTTSDALALPSIDLEYIDQSFQMPEYSTPQFSLSADSSPDEDLVGRLKRLSAGTDLEQY